MANSPSDTAQAAAPKPAPLKTSRKRVLTRRGVMWLGQTCNQRCYFCYFANRITDRNHPEHAFMDLDKAKRICDTLRNVYGNTSIDIQGGEPTIYPQILELISYCDQIGLYPTLITNGLALAKPGVLQQYKDARIRDFLVSLHGVGDMHDEVVGIKGAYDKIIAAIRGMRDAGIPFRFNCTMSKPVVPVITEVARHAIEYGAYVVNYIAFNPFGDQEVGIRTRENVERYSIVKDHLTRAIDMLEDAGIEVNVRYLPLCMAEPRHRKNFYNYQQLSYDSHEWDYQSWLWTMMQPQMMKPSGLVPWFRIGVGARKVYNCNGVAVVEMMEQNPLKLGLKFQAQRALASVQQIVQGKDKLYREEARIRASRDCNYRYHQACTQCAAQQICDGFHGDYAEFFGTDEAVPITDTPSSGDPTFFIRGQDKFVEPEDEAWAL